MAKLGLSVCERTSDFFSFLSFFFFFFYCVWNNKPWLLRYRNSSRPHLKFDLFFWTSLERSSVRKIIKDLVTTHFVNLCVVHYHSEVSIFIMIQSKFVGKSFIRVARSLKLNHTPSLIRHFRTGTRRNRLIVRVVTGSPQIFGRLMVMSRPVKHHNYFKLGKVVRRSCASTAEFIFLDEPYCI